MPDATTATSPAANGGTPSAGSATPAFDPKAFQAELTGSFKTQLAELVKPLQDELAALKKGNEKPADPAKPLSADDITAILDKRDESRQTTARATAARDRYVETAMKGIPPVYTRDLPATEDQAALAAAGERIRVQYREDLKASGLTPPAVTGAANGGNPPAAAVDRSKMTAGQKIELAISRSTPKGAPGKR